MCLLPWHVSHLRFCHVSSFEVFCRAVPMFFGFMVVAALVIGYLLFCSTGCSRIYWFVENQKTHWNFLV